MKKILFTLLVLIFIGTTLGSSIAQNDKTTTNTKTMFTWSKPIWTISFGGSWLLATNDAYGRANYPSEDVISKTFNYGMRWGWGAFLTGRYSIGKKKKSDRIYLGMDYKDMVNTDFEGEAGNKTQLSMATVAGGYEYLFYGTLNFRSYYGLGMTANFMNGTYTPKNQTPTNAERTLENTFRLGMEIKAGLEFIFNTPKRNLGMTIGAKYNLVNLFNDNNSAPPTGQAGNINYNLNDGSGSYGPGFKRYIGIVSIDVGINLYPDVKQYVKKTPP